MRKSLLLLFAFGMVCLLSSAGAAGASGKKEAKRLVERAAAYVKHQGREKALAEIGRLRGMFDKGELYVFAYDLNGVMLAHPKNPELIGRNLLAVPDSDGKLFRREIVDKALARGTGWVDYVYLNPETNEMEHKTTYLRKAGDLILCCGAYREYSHDGD